MDVCIDNNKKTAEWNVGERIITIHNKYMLYAFKHGKNMLMIKEKYELSGSGFSAYDIKGNIIFSYKYLEDSITIRDKKISGIDGKIVSADYEEEKRMLIVLLETGKTRKLLICNEKGNRVAEIESPRGYTFVSLKNNEGKIMVTAQGINDMTKDSFGRNDWNFLINFDNFYVEKKSIIQ